MKNILVVDDEKEICQTLETLLSLDGYKVQSLTNPLDTLKVIETFQPSCILLDMMMSGEDGLSVLKRIKKSSFSSF